jgi:hypothetical protein
LAGWRPRQLRSNGWRPRLNLKLRVIQQIEEQWLASLIEEQSLAF